jgi:hypothetical protein
LLAARAALGLFAAGVTAALYAAAGANERRGEAVAWAASGLRLGGALAGAGAAGLAAVIGVPTVLVLAGAGAVASPLFFRHDRIQEEAPCDVPCSTGT